MAKKQPAAANHKPKSASKSAPKAPAKKTAVEPSAQAITADVIGETAGRVWQFLADEGSLTIGSLKKGVNAPGDAVLAAVGWLAREGKLSFDATGRSVKVTLQQ